MKFKHRAYIFIFYLLRVFPIQKNKVVISNFGGKGYGCNCKYITNALLDKDPNQKLDLVWLTEGEVDGVPDRIRKVSYNSFKSFFELATAKVWIDNIRKPPYVRKRKKQFYIMTWHGGLCFKKVEKDAIHSLRRSYIYSAKNDSSMADLFLADSEWTYKHFQKSFWYEHEIAKCGSPRLDVIFRDDSALKKQIKEKYGISENTKCVLYAPTFRVNNDESSIGVYKLDWKQVIDSLEKKTGDSWIGLIRLHPNVSNLSDKLDLPSNVLDMTSYPDMQELLLVADCFITDYSSAIFEYSVKGKMAFMYAIDLAEYMKDRDFYFNISELPYPFAQSNAELASNILSFSENEYAQKIHEFFHDRCGLYEGGHASEYVANRILEKLDF
jgi:CDP-glycerol glycerophosphotransferase